MDILVKEIQNFRILKRILVSWKNRISNSIFKRVNFKFSLQESEFQILSSGSSSSSLLNFSLLSCGSHDSTSSPVESQAWALRLHPLRRWHHLQQGWREQDHHHRQHRPLPRLSWLLRGRHWRRRQPPQPRPPPRHRESRQLHRDRGPEWWLPPRPSPRPRQALVQLRTPLHLQTPLQTPPRIWRQGPYLARGRAESTFTALVDFILIDCPAGIDASFITAITPANEAILITTPDITSLHDADRDTGLLECDVISPFEQAAWRLVEQDSMQAVIIGFGLKSETIIW